jgi:phospholipid/cholesterol/gamma-HCH transport system substrate-binding protein
VKRQIRMHVPALLAILALVVIAAAVATYITAHERLILPGWVPGIGTDFYQLDAAFETAQAVVPGEGQTVDIAGVAVGEIGNVSVRDGRAVVTMKIRKKYAPVYRDATLLLRPKTPLKDMIVELDPGNRSAGAYKSGDTIPIWRTRPDVDFDEILSALDGDSRSYLMVLLTAGGQAFSEPGAPADLREAFKRFEPTSRDLDRITTLLAERRRNITHVVHDLRLLTGALGNKDTQLAQLVDSSNATFRALADQAQNLRGALQELPATLQQADTTLPKVTTLADQLGPALQSLRPTARELAPALRETRPFLRLTTPIIRDELRPFARGAQPAVHDLFTTARRLVPITPRLTRTLTVVNALLNTLAYNPPGSEEGYLFWASWLNHAGASIFSTQDANGPIRRGQVIASCSSLALLESVAATTPQIQVLFDLLGAPASTSPICESQAKRTATKRTATKRTAAARRLAR